MDNRLQDSSAKTSAKGQLWKDRQEWTDSKVVMGRTTLSGQDNQKSSNKMARPGQTGLPKIK